MSEKEYLKLFEEEALIIRAITDSMYDPELPNPITYDYKPLRDWFNHWAEVHPDKPYLLLGDMALSYAYCNDVARRLGNALMELGVKKGDRVAIMAPNVPQYILGLQAIWKIGGIEVPANGMYTVTELTRQLNDNGSETVIAMAAMAPKAIAMLQDPNCTVKRVIAFQMPGPKVELPQVEGLFDFDAVVAAASNAEPDVEITMDDPVRLQYTGGTTGIPKGCVLTNRMVYTMAVRTVLWTTKSYTMVAQDEVRSMAAIPLNHVYGFNLNVALNIVAGGTIVLVPQPKPDALVEAILKGRPTIWGAVPTMIIGLINMPQVQSGEADFTSLKGVFCGASACPVSVMTEFERITGGTLVEGYGMSESSNILTINPMHYRKPGTVGVELPDTDLLVVDTATGTKLMPFGEDGELICRGTQVIKEYWDNPEETANAIRDGWLYTGDIVSMDQEGFITIKDRKKDMIIVSGFNVFPREIDEVMFANPKVVEACSVGTPHPTKGEAPVLYTVLKPGETMDAKEAEAYLRQSLTGYKIPVDYRFVDEIPKTPAGKPDRKALAALYKAEKEAKA
ncbi:MAG: AMP-binding protein [Oscillospiraceae bacterium]|nr:AMP-binding protein [Oscillospiraceae bacterium]